MEVEKAFIDNGIVPDIIPFAPKKILNVSYRSGVKAELGNHLKPTQVKDMPNVSWEADKSTLYTLVVTDPDAPSRENHTMRECRHWLVTNIPESAFEWGENICEFVGSGPPKDSGLHRYIFLVYKQPNGIIDTRSYGNVD